MSQYKSRLMGLLSEKGVYYEQDDNVERLERLYRENKLDLPQREEGDDIEPIEPIEQQREELADNEDETLDEPKEPAPKKRGRPSKRK